MTKSIIKPKGRIAIRLIKPNGIIIPVYKGHNTIASQIFTAFKASWTNGANDFALDNLIDVGGVALGGAQDGKDGIAIQTSSPASSQSLVTTSVTADETWGAKWHGEITFDSDYTVNWVILGHDYGGSGVSTTDFFDVTYAYNSSLSVVVANLDRLVVDWEIYT